MERGSLYYEKLLTEIADGSSTNRSFIGLRTYFYLGRDMEALKDDTLYFDQDFYSGTSKNSIAYFDVNNIPVHVLKTIRVPEQGNKYKPVVDVLLSESGSGIEQSASLYSSNILYN